MAGRLKKYAFINAKLRAKISKILPEEYINRLISAPTMAESIALLKGTSFAGVEEEYNRTGDLKKGELELFSQEVALYKDLERYLKDELLSFVRALAVRYEIENLKNILRIWFDMAVRGRDTTERAHYLYRDNIRYDLCIERVISAGNATEIAEILARTPYSSIIGENSKSVVENGNIFPLEIALDHFFYSNLLQEISNMESRDRMIAERMIGVEIDIQNINWLIRFRDTYNLALDTVLKYSIPHGRLMSADTLKMLYGTRDVAGAFGKILTGRHAALRTLLSVRSKPEPETSRLILLERILEQIILQEVNHVLAGYPFTVGIILAYFILKQNEIRKILTILNAKYYHIQEERIKGVI